MAYTNSKNMLAGRGQQAGPEVDRSRPVGPAGCGHQALLAVGFAQRDCVEGPLLVVSALNRQVHKLC